MAHPFQTRLLYGTTRVIGGALLLGSAWSCHADGFTWESVGLRGGVIPISKRSDMFQSELASTWNLPWHWNVGSTNWVLQTRLDASAGWMGDPKYDAAVFTVGPTLVLKYRDFPVSLEGGSSPTLVTRNSFQAKDIGEPFQFTSHVGLNYDFARHWRLGYRFQHMSNAGIDSANNPGINAHLLGLSYLF